MMCVYCFGNKVKNKEKMVGGICNGICNFKKKIVIFVLNILFFI